MVRVKRIGGSSECPLHVVATGGSKTTLGNISWPGLSMSIDGHERETQGPEAKFHSNLRPAPSDWVLTAIQSYDL